MIEHKHRIIRAEAKNPPKKEELSMMEEWFIELIEDIDMKLLSGPHTKYVGVEADIKAHPERLRVFDGALYDRLKALVGDVGIDLDEPLSPDDE